MSLADEILRRIEEAFERFVTTGIPGARVTGQVPGAVLPPPAADPDVPYGAPITVQEADGTPIVSDVTTIIVSNGSLTDNGSGSVTIATGGSLPLTTQGDLLTRDASANVRLPIGAGGTYLRSDGSDPSWQPIGAADLPLVDLSDNDFLFGALPVVNGGTGASTAIAAMNNLAVSGTFTPTFAGDGTAGTWTYSVQVGHYRRIGPIVFAWGSLAAASRPSAPTGNARITGLPFTSLNVSNGHIPVTLDSIDTVNLLATTVQLTARIPPNAAYIEFIENPDNAGGSFLPATSFGASSIIRFSGWYTI